jgi:hypothetical protein
MTDWRERCAELVNALAEWQLGGGPPEDTADADLIDRTRAELAQPERPVQDDKSVVYHKFRFMTPISDPCESVRMAVIQALSEAWEGYASPKKITENGRVVWDSDSQDLDDFAESIGINLDAYP